ncbi:hypothetical protein ABZ926_35780 [Streptomyces litmocidini]|uniref:hypothetical protein n=1 Tax=Streptomyces litmocidini TaxID=67318 RepID=UPI0033C4861F
MDQGWAAVIAAGVAGVVALAGAFIGVWLGRRTVRDQAQVEHEQWLRGQRQEAYVTLLAEWDKTLPRFRGHLQSEEDLYHVHETGAWDAASEEVEVLAVALIEPVVLAAERVHMLGPELVDQAAKAMATTAADLASSLITQYAPPQGEGPYTAFHRAMGVTGDCRAAFVTAARVAMQTAPTPKRQ